MFISVNRLGGREPRPIGINPAAVALIWDGEAGANVTLVTGQSFQVDISREAFEARTAARKAVKA
jgi:hypothetical protein